MVVQEVATGRVLAMQGGFDARGDDFNRATQALRQPGSTFKPIVYSAALDNGMTPATLIVDGPSASSRAPASAPTVSATSPAAAPGRRRCAGASSSRATK
jgi:membrane carboxypeptidase/penicillin-binding protein